MKTISIAALILAGAILAPASAWGLGLNVDLDDGIGVEVETGVVDAEVSLSGNDDPNPDNDETPPAEPDDPDPESPSGGDGSPSSRPSPSPAPDPDEEADSGDSDTSSTPRRPAPSSQDSASSPQPGPVNTVGTTPPPSTTSPASVAPAPVQPEPVRQPLTRSLSGGDLIAALQQDERGDRVLELLDQADFGADLDRIDSRRIVILHVEDVLDPRDLPRVLGAVEREPQGHAAIIEAVADDPALRSVLARYDIAPENVLALQIAAGGYTEVLVSSDYAFVADVEGSMHVFARAALNADTQVAEVSPSSDAASQPTRVAAVTNAGGTCTPMSEFENGLLPSGPWYDTSGEVELPTPEIGDILPRGGIPDEWPTQTPETPLTAFDSLFAGSDPDALNPFETVAPWSFDGLPVVVRLDIVDQDCPVIVADSRPDVTEVASLAR